MTKNISSITRVPGFRAIGVACGLKQSSNPDLALILAEQPCLGAAVFTTNTFKAAPVLYDMALLERTDRIQAIVTNAGNANAVTGEQGIRDTKRMAYLTEEVCGLPADSTFVMSTGIIGEKLAMDKVEKGIRLASEMILTKDGELGKNVAQAIITTDLVTKEAFTQLEINKQVITLGGIAKGSGMIHPNMATLLAIIVTDVNIEAVALKAALKQAVSRTFNRVTVDGDTSTNDTVVIMASNRADHPPISTNSPQFETFVTALNELCTSLAKAVARDGEGATKLLEITVRGAINEVEAEIVAKAVATSPLTKTALFGNDPNWGRILAAVGRSGATVDPSKISLRLGSFQLVELGEPLDFDAVAAHDWLASCDELKLTVDLGIGQTEATVWSCDFSYKYVEINAEYHT